MTGATAKKVGTLAAVILILTIGFSTSAKATDWWENIKFGGDFRYRHETIDKENSDIRNRQRIRARINLEGKVSDEAKIVIGISSGSSDPVSNNQTLTDAFASKNLLIDKAYFEIKPGFAKGLEILGGKTDNPFFKPGKSELIWDSDIRPEGITLNYSNQFDKLGLKLIGSGQWIQERSQNNESYLAGGQAVLDYQLNEEKSSVAVGGGYFYYGNVKDFNPFYEADNTYGNSEYTTSDTTIILIPGGEDTTITKSHFYMYGYELLELFAQVSHKINDIPITVMGDYVTNGAADSLNNGWLVGIRVGKTKKPGSWDFRYIYREVKKDAVLGLFTDSDFGGGGTDAKGHEIGASYQLMNNTTFAVSYFNNKLEETDQIDYQRWQFDLVLKF